MDYRRILSYTAPAALAGFLAMGCAARGDVRNLQHNLGQTNARVEDAMAIAIDAAQRSSRVEFEAFVLGNRLRDVQEKIPSLESRVAKIGENPHSYRVLQRGRQYDVSFGRMMQLVLPKYSDAASRKMAEGANIMYIGETPEFFAVILGYDCNNNGLLEEGRLACADASGRPFIGEDKVFKDADGTDGFKVPKQAIPGEVLSAVLRAKTIVIR